MDVNECIVKALESIGVDHVFGGSGQVNASMLLALKRSKKIKTIIVRNEQAASFMACGYSMFSDKLGVCFATGGPGAFNLFSGMAVALSDSLPVLGITGYTSMQDRGKGALNESSGVSRTPDSQAMFSCTTKKSFLLEKPEDTLAILEEAINLAFAGRPGPVHIHIPKDVTSALVPSYREISLKKLPVVPDQESLENAAEVLKHAIQAGKLVTALVGYGVIRSEAEQDVLRFIERFQIPVVTTMDAKGVIPEDHPLSAGVYGTSGDPGAKRVFEDAQIILAIGNSFAQNATFGFKPDLLDGKLLIHINIDDHEIGKVYPADCPVHGDAGIAVREISAILDAAVAPAAKRHIVREKWTDSRVDCETSKIHPADLVRIISRNLPPDSVVMGDAGSHMLWLSCYLSLNRNQRYQNPGSFGPMASHVNGCIGVKCALPERRVICGCGDGGYLMGGFELLTAVYYGIPIIWIIFNNGEFNVIKKFLLNMYGEHAYMEFENPDYLKYAEACKAVGYRAETLQQGEEAFLNALKIDKPVIIDVQVAADVYPPFALGKV